MQLFMFDVGEGMDIGLKRGHTIINLSKGFEVYMPDDEDEEWNILFLMSLDEMIMEEKFSLNFLDDVYDSLEDDDQILALTIEDDINYGLPIYDPTKILALGRNYPAHAKEGGHEVPTEPIFFNKLITTMLPHEKGIIYPRQVKRLDHEIELAVVIGDSGRNIPASDAMRYVAGYTIANDITARDMQRQDIERGHPWLRSKNFDTFLPIGPYLVPRDAVDPHNLAMELRVNGEVRQKSNTSEMVFKIPEIISYISQYMTLHPSDIILTGTPEGISPLAVGDVVEASIEGLGTLRNTVVAEEA